MVRRAPSVSPSATITVSDCSTPARTTLSLLHSEPAADQRLPDSTSRYLMPPGNANASTVGADSFAPSRTSAGMSMCLASQKASSASLIPGSGKRS
jgi:hypothetical protein